MLWAIVGWGLVDRQKEAYEQSTIANFCFGLARAADWVAAPMAKPTVTMTPHFWLSNALMFLA
jgi:hypothetical protein